MIDRNRIIEPQPYRGHRPDRRRHTRWALDRACRVRRTSTVTFEPGRTHDISPGGACVIVNGANRFAVGDRVQLAVAWTGESTLSRDGLIAGQIVRITDIEGGQRLAVRFEHDVSLSAGLLDPAV